MSKTITIYHTHAACLLFFISFLSQNLKKFFIGEFKVKIENDRTRQCDDACEYNPFTIYPTDFGDSNPEDMEVVEN